MEFQRIKKYFTKLTKLIRSRLQAHRALVYCCFIALGLSMVWSWSNWLIFIGLLPLLIYIEKMDNQKNKTVITDFFIGGLMLCLLANFFLLQLEPDNWTVQLNGWFGVVVTLSAWIIIGCFCALGYSLLGYVLLKIKSTKYRLLSLPALFVMAEIIRSYIFAAVSYGPHGTLSPNFNWGSVAVPASGTPLVYGSRVVGFFGLTFLVVVINIALYLVYRRWNVKKGLLLPACLLVAVFSISLIGWSIGNSGSFKTSNVSIVHLNSISDMTLADEKLWPPKETDILVLPEYSALLKYDKYRELLSRLSKNGVAITTISNGQSPTATNRIVVVNREGKTLSWQDKTFLIPTGEYMPYVLQIIARGVGKSQVLTDFTYTQQLIPGSEPEKVYTSNDQIGIGVLACSGVSALNQYRYLTKAGADILVNSASLSFIKPNSTYHNYAINMARFQAVSNNRPFIQAMRSGRSYVMDNQGRILAQSNGQANQILNTKLPY